MTSQSCLAHKAYKGAYGELPSRIHFAATPYELVFASNPTDVTALTWREFLYWRLFRDSYSGLGKDHDIDLVFLPYLDYCTNAIALLGSPFASTPWAGITMRPSFHHSATGIRCPRSRLFSIKERLFLRVLAIPTLKRLSCIDELLEKYLSAKDPLLAGKLRYLPDPAEVNGVLEKAVARKTLGIPEDVTLVLSYGSIDPRKGIDSLLSALKDPRLPSNVHVLLAGASTVAGQEMLADQVLVQGLRDAGRLHILDCYLGVDEELTVFAASDMAWLGYRDHYTMSGVMVQAGRMGLPIIASRDGIIGWTTMTYSLGVTVDVDDCSSVASAILDLVNDPRRAHWLGQNGQQRFEHHTSSEFGRVVFEDIEKPLEGVAA
jgi:glycosyltransferase involved in cell wall biosynthesis